MQSSASPVLQIQQDVPLAPYTTLRIGGVARFFAEIASESELVEAVHFARQRGLSIFVLGGGSNLLVGDSGFDGIVLHVAVAHAVIVSGLDYTVAAGGGWDEFVLQVCRQGISGVECLAGIPGSVGGTPVQNVGAYGQEVATTIASVRAFDLEAMAFVDIPREECGFAYRRSIFNTTHRGRYVVTAVTFRFDASAKPNLTYVDLARHFAGQTPTPIEVYDAVREIRHAKGMLIVDGEPDSRSAGSFFKNPVVSSGALDRIAQSLGLEPGVIPHWPSGEDRVKLPAAWLVERAGFHKGFALGEAGISSRHTLALINRGHATAADIVRLRDMIREQVERRFGVLLEQEPVLVG